MDVSFRGGSFADAPICVMLCWAYEDLTNLYSVFFLLFLAFPTFLRTVYHTMHATPPLVPLSVHLSLFASKPPHAQLHALPHATIFFFLSNSQQPSPSPHNIVLLCSVSFWLKNNCYFVQKKKK